MAAFPAHTLAGLLDLILNIYWTFSLMPTTWEMSHMMGVKAKTDFFLQEAGLKKAISSSSLLGTHIYGIPLGVTFLQHRTLSEVYHLELARQLN